MKIDSHVHLFQEKVRSDRTPYCRTDAAFDILYSSEKSKIASEQQIIDYLDSSGIDKAVVFGFPWTDPELVKENNDAVWSFHQKHPDRIIPFAVLSAAGGQSAHDEAQRTLRGGFAGLGELAMYHGGWNAAGFEDLAPCLKTASDLKAPVLLHVNEPVGHQYPGKIGIDFDGLFHLIAAHPDVDFILAHFAGGMFVYGLMPEIAAVLRRTYLDTAASPFLYDSKVFDIAARIMGPEKILFGSDFPLLGASRYIRQIDESGLDAAARDGILGNNALKLLASVKN